MSNTARSLSFQLVNAGTTKKDVDDSGILIPLPQQGSSQTDYDVWLDAGSNDVHIRLGNNALDPATVLAFTDVGDDEEADSVVDLARAIRFSAVGAGQTHLAAKCSTDDTATIKIMAV